LAARPGQIERTDYEYQRHGQANLFMLFAPLEAWREVEVRQTRNATDYAQVIRHLLDECFPDADKVVLVQDNLSTHHASSLIKPLLLTRRNVCYKSLRFTTHPYTVLG